MGLGNERVLTRTRFTRYSTEIRGATAVKSRFRFPTVVGFLGSRSPCELQSRRVSNRSPSRVCPGIIFLPANRVSLDARATLNPNWQTPRDKGLQTRKVLPCEGTGHTAAIPCRHGVRQEDWPRPSVLDIAERPNILQSLREIAPASSVRVDWTQGFGVNVVNASEIPFNDAAQVPAP